VTKSLRYSVLFFFLTDIRANSVVILHHVKTCAEGPALFLGYLRALSGKNWIPENTMLCVCGSIQAFFLIHPSTRIPICLLPVNTRDFHTPPL